MKNKGHIKAGVELQLAVLGFLLLLNKKIFRNEKSFSSRVRTVEIALRILSVVAITDAFPSFSLLPFLPSWVVGWGMKQP